MTIKEVIALLKELGHDVKFHKRKDGGYLIKEIDGKKYTGAKGNAEGRFLTGQKISEKRQAQLQSIRPPKLQPLDKELKKALRKTQQAWKKNAPKVKGKITAKRLRENIKKFGREEALKSLNKAQKYAEGIAYEENVDLLLARIASDIERANLQGMNTDKLEKVYDKIDENKDSFKESWISKCYDELYKLEQGQIDADSCAINIANICNFNIY